jgi:hypothetical protein
VATASRVGGRTAALRAQADTGRRGPDGLSREFDAAVEHLNRAGAESDLADVVAAYAAVAAAAAAIADALEAAGE